MRKHFFNHTRGASYTDFPQQTDKGLKQLGEQDLERRLAREAASFSVLSTEEEAA